MRKSSVRRAMKSLLAGIIVLVMVVTIIPLYMIAEAFVPEGSEEEELSYVCAVCYEEDCCTDNECECETECLCSQDNQVTATATNEISNVLENTTAIIVTNEVLADFGPATISFHIDGVVYHEVTASESGFITEPEQPTKPNLHFKGWYTEDGSLFDFESAIFSSINLYAKFYANVSFLVMGEKYIENIKVDEGKTITQPEAPVREGYDFVSWRSYQHGVFNFNTPVTEDLELTASFSKQQSTEDKYSGMWQPGPNEKISIQDKYQCYENPNSNHKAKNIQYFFDPITKKLVYIIITCECGVVYEFKPESNNATLDKDGGQVQGGNNIKLGVEDLKATYIPVVFLGGTDGITSHNGPGQVIKGSTWDTNWEPEVYANAGYTFIGWVDQFGVRYRPNDPNFESPINQQYTFTAVYTQLAPLTIRAASNFWLYTGETFRDSGFTTSSLPTGYKVIADTVKVVGEIVEPGTVVNEIITKEGIVVLDTLGNDVTNTFLITIENGLLTVTERTIEALITITAASAEKEYDGTALRNSNYTQIGLPNGYFLKDVSVEGSQTDKGKSSNIVTGYRIVRYNTEGNEVDVTSYFTNVKTVDGVLSVIANNTASIVINAASQSKEYDGTPLENAGFTVEGDLDLNEHRVEATVEGSITKVGNVPNVITQYSIIRNSDNKDVTDYFTSVTLNNGTLTVTPNTLTTILLIASSATKQYDGTPLTSENVDIRSRELPYGHSITATTKGSITDIGEEANLIESIVILNAAGENVTEYFTKIRKVPGVLVVTENDTDAFIIIPASDSKKYDSTPLTNSEFSFIGILGYTVEATIAGSITDVGTEDNVVEDYKIIRDSDSSDVTAFFKNVSLQKGLLEVTPNTTTEFVITAASANQVYNGSELTDDGYIVEGPDEYNVTATVAGSIIEVGSVSNEVIEYVIIRKTDNKDVTDYFTNVKTVEGNLEVTPASLQIVAYANPNRIYPDDQFKLEFSAIGWQKEESFTTEDALAPRLYTDFNGTPGEYTIKIEDVLINQAEESYLTYINKKLKNYTVTVVTSNLIVDDFKDFPKLSLIALPSVGVYNKNEYSANISHNSDVNATISYQYYDAVNGDWSELSSNNPGFTNVGVYLVKATLSAQNYNPVEKITSVTILPRPILVSPIENEKVYGEDDPNLEYELTIVGNEIQNWQDDIAKDFEFTVVREEGEDVAKYPMTVNVKGTSNNYKIVVNNNANGGRIGVPFNFTITPAVLIVTAQDLTVVEGTPREEIFATVSFSGFRRDDTAEVVTLGTVETEYEATAVAGDTFDLIPTSFSANNYIIEYINGLLDIVADDTLPEEPTKKDPKKPTEEPEDPSEDPNNNPEVTPPTQNEETQIVNSEREAQVAVPLSSPIVPQSNIASNSQGSIRKTWALVNLILTILVAVIGVFVLISLFSNKGSYDDYDEIEEELNPEEVDKRKRNRRYGKLFEILALLMAILAPIVFILTEDIRNRMILTDRWTLLMLALLIVQLIGVTIRVILKRKRTEYEEAAPEIA